MATIRYRIGEGVRRAVGAREMGNTHIIAKVMGGNNDLVELPLDELGVEAVKAIIYRDQRFVDALMAVGRHTAAPIEVHPVSPEASRSLVPLREVKLEKTSQRRD